MVFRGIGASEQRVCGFETRGALWRDFYYASSEIDGSLIGGLVSLFFKGRKKEKPDLVEFAYLLVEEHEPCVLLLSFCLREAADWGCCSFPLLPMPVA